MRKTSLRIRLTIAVLFVSCSLFPMTSALAGRFKQPEEARPNAQPLTTADRPISRGHLPKRSVRFSMRANLSKVRACYVRELGRRPNLKVRISTRFVVEPTGYIFLEPKVQASSGGEKRLCKCISKVLKDIRFPQVYDIYRNGERHWGKSTAVRYGFRFKPVKKKKSDPYREIDALFADKARPETPSRLRAKAASRPKKQGASKASHPVLGPVAQPSPVQKPKPGQALPTTAKDPIKGLQGQRLEELK
jgi:hypothetical protein